MNVEKTEEVKVTEGKVITGKVTGIQPYGLFVKLNDECSGLVHRTELDKLASETDEEDFKIGQLLKVKVLRVKPGGKQAILRVHRDTLTRRRKTATHYETSSGFEPLREQLPSFIKSALEKEENK